MDTEAPVINNSNYSAPWFSVAERQVVSIEHPCLVKNVQKGVDMLGGEKALAATLPSDSETTLSLNFRPHDPTSRGIISSRYDTENILLKITVPKWTGRKRKRGSGVPFENGISKPSDRSTARHLIQSLTDNREKSHIEAIGNICSTQKWRSMPDYVYSISESKFLTEIEHKILPREYPSMKTWTFPRTYGLTDTETMPPPVFSNVSLAHNYIYRQNPAVKAVADPSTGKKTLHNTQAPIKIYTQQCKVNDPEYPRYPPPDCPALSEQSPAIQRIHQMILKLFEDRPIWTRRALINNLPDDAPIFFARFALAYIAFTIRSGPWRDTLCKLGIDPRKEPIYRKYQTIFLQLAPRDRPKELGKDEFGRNWNRSKDRASHIFTGKQKAVAADGKIWQFCDLEDPQLKALVDLPDVYIRAECEIRYFGWYHNGTTAKLRVALKAKVDALNNESPLDESLLQRFLALPEDWDGKAEIDRDGEEINPMSGYLPKDASRKELEWASVYRALCRTQDGKAPPNSGSGKGRLSKSKPNFRSSFLASEQDDTVEVEPEDHELEEADVYVGSEPVESQEYQEVHGNMDLGEAGEEPL